MKMPQRKRHVVSALLAVACLAVGLAGCDGGPEPPAPDLSEMEPRVAALIEDGQAEVRRNRESAPAWGQLGAAFHVHRLESQAEVCYLRARELDPNDFRWAYLLAIAREALGADPEELRRLFDEAATLRPDYAQVPLRFGLALSRRGIFGGAQEALRRAVELDPTIPMAQRALGQALLGLGEPEQALDPLARAALLRPRDGATFSALAQAYMQLGESEMAREAASRAGRLAVKSGFADPVFRETVDVHGTSAALGVGRVQRQVARGELDSARAEAAAMLELRPDDPDMHFLAGHVARARGEADDARAHFDRALDLDPEHVQSLGELAGLLESRRAYTEALALRKRAWQIFPRDPSLIIAIGRVQQSLGDLDGLIDTFTRLAEVSPDAAAVEVDLGTALGRKGDLAAAERHFRRGLEIDPDHAEAHYRLGVALESQDRPSEAAEHYRAAIKVDATHRAAERLKIVEKPAKWPSPREEFGEIGERLYAGQNLYLGRGRVTTQRERMAEATSLSLDAEIGQHVELSRLLLQTGEVDEAIEEAERAMTLAAGVSETRRLAELFRFRGLAYMRQAELQNCVLRHNRDCCIFPLKDGGVHEAPEPARQARLSFEKVLQFDPGDLRAIWLLNVMAMALGEYPGGVPESHRVPPEALRSEAEFDRFHDIAPALGIDTFNLCGGAIADDFDGDGLLDLVTSTFDPLGPLQFYRNDGRGGFEDRSAVSRADEQLGGLNAIGADYDNDGDPDVLVLRGAWMFDDGQIRNSLLRNDDGVFTDVTRAAGMGAAAYPTQAATWDDFDNDGDLDLFVCNESRKEMPVHRADFPAQMFLNRGDGTFTEVARQVGVTNDRYCKGVASGDYDNDGDIDLYLSNVHENRLYRNNGDGSFDDVARQAGVIEPSGRSFATWFFDYDNDGWLDLFVAGFDSTIGDLAAQAFGLPHAGRLPRLYRNKRDGTFEDVTAEVHLDRVYLPMGANFGDPDNDGWLDIYLATGDPKYESLMPNVMLRNDGGRRFLDVTTSGGFGHLQKGHGVAFADLDNDGDQDLYHQLGGFYPGDRFHNALFENPGNGNHWLVLELVGTRTNRAGFGARIRVVIDTPGGVREIHRAVGSVSSFGGSPRRQEIGLGDATAIRRVEVVWPVSRTRQVLESVELDRALRLTEGREGFEELSRPTVRFRR